MQWLKRGAFELLATLLLASLLGIVLFSSSNHTFSSSTNIKKWFSQSGLYDQLITNSINNTQNSVGGGDTIAISLKDPITEKIARSVFSPDVVQQNVESFIDSNYAWLQGKTETPDFRIDLTQNKQTFAQQVGLNLQDYLTGLKPCSAEQVKQFQAVTTSGNSIDPFVLACLPPGINPTTEATKVTQQLSNGPFIDQPLITADTISSDYGPNNGEKAYFETYKALPTAYQAAQKIPYVLAAGVIFIVILLFASASNHRAAIRRVAFVSLIAGLLLIGVKFTSDYALNKVQDHVFSNSNASALQGPLTNILHGAEKSLVSVDFYGGLIYVAIAVVIFAWLLTHRGPSKPRPVVAQGGATPIVDPEAALRDVPEDDEDAPRIAPQNMNAPTAPTLRPSSKRARPSMDVMGPSSTPKQPVKKPAAPIRKITPAAVFSTPKSTPITPTESSLPPKKPTKPPRPRSRFLD